MTMKDILMAAVAAFGMAFCSTLAIECLIMAWQVYRENKKES